MNCKKLLAAFAVLTTTITLASAEEYKNYELILDGKRYELSLDEELRINTRKGETLTVLLKKKPFSQYSDHFVSFQHKSAMTISSQEIGKGVRQLLSTTATGTMLFLQEHSIRDPSMFVPLLTNQLTQKQERVGYRMMTQENVTREVSPGIKLSGVKATMEKQGEEVYLEVLGYGKKQRGIIVVTQIHRRFIESDKEILDRFWETLTVKF